MGVEASIYEAGKVGELLESLKEVLVERVVLPADDLWPGRVVDMNNRRNSLGSFGFHHGGVGHEVHPLAIGGSDLENSVGTFFANKRGEGHKFR